MFGPSYRSTPRRRLAFSGDNHGQASLRKITDGGELFVWLIDRLNGQGEQLPLDPESIQTCRRFVEKIAGEEVFHTAPTTTGALRLAILRSAKRADGGRIGADVVAYLGGLGDRLSQSELPQGVSLESCTVNALWGWRCWEGFLFVRPGAETLRFASNMAAAHTYGVKIDVELPSYDF